jgi:uncharacterized membrane protein
MMVLRSGPLLLIMLLAAPAAAGAQVPQPPDTALASAAHAVLFYSPACPHCRDLITNGLPPILRRFGERLVIVGLDVTTEGGQAQYQAMVRRFGVTPDRQGVPTLVIGSRVLVGSVEIPSELPGLVERGLAAGGVDWPDLPLLRQTLAARGMLAPRGQAAAPAAAERAGAESADVAAPPPREARPGVGRDTAAAAAAPPPAAPETVAGAAPAAANRPAPLRAAPEASPGAAGVAAYPPLATPPPTPGTTTPVAAAVRRDSGSPAGPVVIGAGGERSLGGVSIADRFLADPVGNAASVIVLLAMTAGLALVAGTVRGGLRLPRMPGWTIPVLAVVGIGVAAYLSFVEMTGTRAVCGPVGDCNTVQQSAYAKLLGVPIGVVGLGGYVAMVAAWIVGVRGRAGVRDRAWLAIWAMALVGTAFSMYLTFLEPFVIGATCAWCLSSAVIVTLILIAATPPAARILRAREAAAA